MIVIHIFYQMFYTMQAVSALQDFRYVVFGNETLWNISEQILWNASPAISDTTIKVAQVESELICKYHMRQVLMVAVPVPEYPQTGQRWSGVSFKHLAGPLGWYPAATHDDVINWKHFPCHWPLCGEFAGHTGEFPAQRPVTRSFDVFFDLRLNKRLGK